MAAVEVSDLVSVWSLQHTEKYVGTYIKVLLATNWCKCAHS